MAQSQTIFIDSAKALGTSSDFYVTFPAGFVTCGQDEKMSIVLEKYTTLADWNLINAGVYFFVLDTTSTAPVRVDVEPGNPTLDELAQRLTASVNAVRPSMGFICQYERSANRYIISSTKGRIISLRFPTIEIAKLFGFDALEYGPAAVLKSGQLQPLAFDTIMIEVTGFCPSARNLSTQTQGTLSGGDLYYDQIGQMDNCSVLACFVVDCAPYTWLKYENTGDTFTIDVADKQITQLRFRFTNWQGQELIRLSDPQYMQLRIDKHKKLDNTGVLLSNILRTMQIGLLSMDS